MRRLPLFALGMCAALVHGQNGPALTPVPGDPKALAIFVSQSNGLVGPDIHPWHLKAKFQLLKTTGVFNLGN